MPTGIIFITIDNVNIQPTIAIAVNKLGKNKVKPLALLAKPFAAVPKTTANNRITQAIILFTIREYSYFVILSTNFFAIGPTNKAVAIAIGSPTTQAFKNLFK